MSFVERAFIRGVPKQRRRVHGEGINDAPYPTAYRDEYGQLQKCPYFVVWLGMMERVFSKALHRRRPTYSSCTVDPSWKTFSVFKAWMQTQDWQGKHLDKDLLIQGNKHYGPDTCIFVSPSLNNLLTLRDNARGPYPLGVSRTVTKGYSYFVASCSFYGKQKRLGYFQTVEEAADCYRQAKMAHIRELAEQQSDPRLKRSLLNMC